MNEKRRQSFRVTHLFSPHSAETKPRRGAMPGTWPGPMADGTAPVLTLTTVPSVLLNPQIAWLLASVWPQHVWISHKTERHAGSWPLLQHPCVPPHCQPQHGLRGGGQSGRRGWAWQPRNQTWELLGSQEREKKPVSGTESCYQPLISVP